MSAVLFFSILTLVLFLCAAHRKYRKRIPVASHIVDVDVRRRIYPNGAVGYFFSNKPVPLYELPFVLADLYTLRRQNVLDIYLEYVDKNGYIIPDTPEFQTKLDRYCRLLHEFFEVYGPESKPASRILRRSPFAYCQELYSLKRSSVSGAKPSFS